MNSAALPVETFLCGACSKPVPFTADQTGGVSIKCPSCGQASVWKDGILVIRDEANADYPEESYDLLVEAQARHFWFKARNNTILHATKEVVGYLRGKRLLDVGCGDGYVTQAFEVEGLLCCGLDMYIEGLVYARQRMKGLVVQDTAARIPFESQFDIVTLFDVIEHVDDDVGLLKESMRALKPGGGHVVVTVPAHQSLWTQLDDASGHKRRYNKVALTRSFEAAGLEV